MTQAYMSAAETYAARVDAVIAQRTRFRGPQPAGDLFAMLPAGSSLLCVDARRALEPTLEAIASRIEPDDVIVDVGGGAGRQGLPLALRCRQVINVEASAAMITGFLANAKQGGVANVQAIHADWSAIDPPRGSVALVNHVTYLVREIVPFIEKLMVAASRRVLLTVNDPPPPSWNRELYRLLFGEAEEIVPGHVELLNVLREMGIDAEVTTLPRSTPPFPPMPSREAAIQHAMGRFGGDQWALWPLGPELERRLLELLETRFETLFTMTPGGWAPTWITPGHEVLMTWKSRP